jgi:hypothetical protein
MRSNFRVGKTIAGFAFTVSRDPDSPNSRMLLDTFAKTKDRAQQKLVNSKKYFYSQGDGVYRLYSVHMTVMRELEFNLDDGTEGFPCLDDDEDIEPEVKMINGRLVIEDAFDLKNPIKTTRRRNQCT